MPHAFKEDGIRLLAATMARAADTITKQPSISRHYIVNTRFHRVILGESSCVMAAQVTW